MPKIIDRIILITILFVIFTLWSTYITQNFFIGISISAILMMIFGLFLKPNKKIKFNPLNYVNKLTSLSFREQNELFIKAISPRLNPQKDKNGLIKVNETELFLPHLRFSKLPAGEIFRKSLFAQKRGYTKLLLLNNGYDESAFNQIKPYLPIPTELISTTDAIVSLGKLNLLPEIPKSQKKKPAIKEIFKSAFNKRNAKYFLLSGFSLGFLAIFTPLKLYYLCFCTVSLSFSALCFFRKTKKQSSTFK